MFSLIIMISWTFLKIKTKSSQLLDKFGFSKTANFYTWGEYYSIKKLCFTSY